MLAPISCPKSVKLELTGGDMEEDLNEVELSEGVNGLATRGTFGGVGGARPLPLPKMRPPPNLRVDMMKAAGECVVFQGC